MNFPPTKKRTSSALVGAGIFLAAIMLVVLAGLAACRSEAGRVAAAQDAMLEAVAELKSRQIEAWRRDRAFDAWRLAHGKFLRGAIGRLSDPAVAGELRDHLSLQSAPGGGDVLVFSPEGRLLLSTREDSHDESLPMDPALERAVAEALAKKEAVASDLYRCPAGGFIPTSRRLCPGRRANRRVCSS